MNEWKDTAKESPPAGAYIVIDRNGALYAGYMDDNATYLCGGGLREGYMGLLPGDKWIRIPEPRGVVIRQEI